MGQIYEGVGGDGFISREFYGILKILIKIRWNRKIGKCFFDCWINFYVRFSFRIQLLLLKRVLMKC